MVTAASRPSGSHTGGAHNPVSCPFSLVVSSPKLFLLSICLWAFQITTLMSYALLPWIQVISTGISTYKQRQWAHPLSSKGPSELDKCLTTKVMTEEDAGILHHNMYFFSLPLRLSLQHHPASLGFCCYSASPEQRGNGSSSLLRRLGLANQTQTVFTELYCCLSCFPWYPLAFTTTMDYSGSTGTNGSDSKTALCSGTGCVWTMVQEQCVTSFLWP